MKRLNIFYIAIFLMFLPSLILPQVLVGISKNYNTKDINDELTDVINKLQTALNTKNSALLSAIICNKVQKGNAKKEKIVENKNSDNFEIKTIDPENFNIRFEIVNKRKLNNNSFMLNTAVTIYGAVNKINITINIKAVKKEGQWFILSNFNIEKIITGLIKTSKNKKTFSITPSLDRINNTALIPFPHYNNPDCYDINRALTLSELNRKLFSWRDKIDVLKINYGTNVNDLTVFATDNHWNRIIYSKNGSKQIKAFDKTNANLADWHINGIAAPMNFWGPNYYLFVVSGAPSNKITKLNYDPVSNNIQFIANYSVPGSICLSDISIMIGDNSKLWVTDPHIGISILNTSGELLKTYTQFYYNGQNYPIQNIYKLEVSNSGPTIGFIDKDGYRLVICRVNEYANNRLEAYNVVEVPTSSNRFGDVGINYDSELYFSQENIIHKFNLFGEYICSFQNSAWFKHVGAISNFAADNPDYPVIVLYITNQWCDENGIRRYLLGSDAIDLSFQQLGYNSLQFNYRTTGSSYVKVEILQNNNVIKTLKEVNWEFSGLHSIVNNYSDLLPGNYQMKVSYKHWQDDTYENFQQGLRTKLINFTVTAPPLSVSIYGPSILNSKEKGTWSANVSGGSGSHSYAWYKSYNGGSYWSGVLGTANTYSTTMLFGDIVLKCDVHDTQTNENASATELVKYNDGTPDFPLKQKTEKKLPENYMLSSNYPNPFNPTTIIKYQLKEPGFVSLKVYSILGKEVINLVNENKSAGFYSVSLNASNFTSGLYIYRLRVNDFVESKKMLLIK